MVNQIASPPQLASVAGNLLHPRDEHVGVDRFAFAFLADNLVHQRDKPAGV
jgi:hypothetical protein